MKKITTAVRVTELADVADRLLVLYTNSNLSDAFLTPVFDELKTLHTQIITAINQETATSRLDMADKVRDTAIRNLHDVLKGYSVMPLDHLKSSGTVLLAVFNRYGVKITNENYSSESALIMSLLQDLASADLVHHIASLSGVFESIEQVRFTQESFERVRQEHEKILAQKSATPSATKLKKPLFDIINGKIITYLNTMSMVDADKYRAFADLVCQVVDSANNTVKRKVPTEKKVSDEPKSEPTNDTPVGVW